MNRRPFKSAESTSSTRKLELVHSDVCGPMQTESFGGCRYFVAFIDDYKFTMLQSVFSKAQVFEKYKEFEAKVTNECGYNIGTLRTDNGGEFIKGVSSPFDLERNTS